MPRRISTKHSAKYCFNSYQTSLRIWMVSFGFVRIPLSGPTGNLFKPLLNYWSIPLKTWEWISNFITYFIMDAIIYHVSQTMLVKGSTDDVIFCMILVKNKHCDVLWCTVKQYDWLQLIAYCLTWFLFQLPVSYGAIHHSSKGVRFRIWIIPPCWGVLFQNIVLYYCHGVKFHV